LTRTALIITALALLTITAPAAQGEIDTCTEVGRVTKKITGLNLELGYLHPVELDVDVIAAVVDAADELNQLGSRFDRKQSPASLKKYSDDLAVDGQRLKKSALAWSHEGMVTSLSSAGQTLMLVSHICSGKE
jgi:hypothetical protein